MKRAVAVTANLIHEAFRKVPQLRQTEMRVVVGGCALYFHTIAQSLGLTTEDEHKLLVAIHHDFLVSVQGDPFHSLFSALERGDHKAITDAIRDLISGKRVRAQVTPKPSPEETERLRRAAEEADRRADEIIAAATKDDEKGA
jgi:hypothetical protein